MTQFLQQLTGNFTNSFVAIAMTLIALGLGSFSILYLNKRRQMLHKERMASLIKGLHYAGVAHEVFGKAKPQGCNHLLCGLRWLLGAIGLAAAVYGYIALQPGTSVIEAIRGALSGTIPGAIGLAHLLFYWFTGRKAPVTNLPTGYRPGVYYRPAAYRASAGASKQS